MTKTQPVPAKYNLLIQNSSLPAWCMYRFPARLSVPAWQERKVCLSVNLQNMYALVCSVLHIREKSSRKRKALKNGAGTVGVIPCRIWRCTPV